MIILSVRPSTKFQSGVKWLAAARSEVLTEVWSWIAWTH